MGGLAEAEQEVDEGKKSGINSIAVWLELEAEGRELKWIYLNIIIIAVYVTSNAGLSMPIYLFSESKCE